MRRRLTIATVGLVAGALIVAGLGTLLLIRRSARDEARRELVSQAEAIAAQAEAASRPNLVVLRRALRLENAVAVGIGPGGRVLDPLPAGVEQDDLDVARLRAGQTVTGERGQLVFAAAPVVRPRGVLAVVLTQRVAGGEGGAGAYLLLTGGASLAVAALVAGWLAGRITRPLEAAEAATRRIAAGDLNTEVPVSPATEPEVASLARSINAMAAELARAQGLERQFLMSVSHDLRTPLTSIRGYAEAITDGTAKDVDQAARVIGAESRRLERLVADLLDLAKLDARQFSLHPQRLDVREVVAEAVEGLARAVAEAGLHLELDVPDGAVLLEVDPDRLGQVVTNLVENASKFATGRIAVRVTETNEGVVLIVEDDGPGIPAEDLAHVFDRLYQSARAPARTGGSGLGLAIVAELVGAMGGRVEARAGGGAQLVVTLSRSSSSSA